MRPHCVDCGEEVRPADLSTYHRIEGWEKYRQAGGANQITLRRVFDEYMCGQCMKLRQMGVSVDQEKLF